MKSKVFNKEILIKNLNKPFLRILPSKFLEIVYFSKPAWHRYECSFYLYMPRFIEENPDWSFWRHGSPIRYLGKGGKNCYLYPYLNELNQRYLDLVGAVDLEGLALVDLNAGHGNLMNYLPVSTHYRGNDIFPQNSHVEEIPDQEFVRTILNVDVLCMFGWVTGMADIESSTQDESLKFLLRKFNPKYFVTESINEYYPLIADRFKIELSSYSELLKVNYSVPGRHPNRLMTIWERIEI